MTATILVIDDSEDDLTLCRHAFNDSDSSFKVITATSAQAGLAHITDTSPDSKRPDLIVLDYNLPDMDGLSFMKHLSANSDIRIPIIMLTGQDNAAVAVEAFKNGVDDYLVKDYQGQYLKLLPSVTSRVIDAHIQRRQDEHTEANLRATLDNLPYLTWLKDIEGRYITINKAFADFLHLEHPQQAIGKTDLDLQPKELAEKYRTDDAMVLAERKQKHVEELAFDGKNVHWVETFKTPVIDNNGKLLGTVGFARNITGRKKGMAALQLQSEIVANAAQGICVVKASDGTIHYANRRFDELFGYASGELTGKHISIINAPSEQTPQQTAVGIMHVIEKQGEWHGEVLNQRKDGTVLWTYANVSFFQHAELGTLFITYQSDITDRKRIEQEMIALNIRLKHKVDARTQELAALTAHTLNVAEEERSNISRELHDELGSALVGISMEVGRMTGKYADPEILRDLSRIRDLLSAASETTRRVVNRLYPTVLSNAGLVAAIEWQVREFRKYSAIAVELIMSEDSIDAEDAIALAAYRITQECLTNIAKHSEASHVIIEVKSFNGFLGVVICDNGKGMNGANDTAKSGSHGILGMIERARHLGGSIEFVSGKGHGTTVHLRLPLETSRPKHKKRVLVVEDHAIVRDAIRLLLARETDDFAVEGEACDGVAAVQMATSDEWDIVLLDINLPKKSGIKVLEEIVAAKPDLPVIMLSSYTKEEFGEMAVFKGAACYVEKGETDKLVDAMRQAISSFDNMKIKHPPP